MVNGETRLAGIIANPIKHSLSPFIHNLSFDLTGENGIYVSLETKEADLKDAINMIRIWDMYGVNISMPYKKTVIPYLDALSTEAELTQAVNTVVLKDGKLIGHNTDGLGFLSFLESEHINYLTRDVVILGAGGASKAIIVQLALNKALSIHVFKRQNESFEAFVSEMDALNKQLDAAIFVYDFHDVSRLNQLLETSVILVNTTNVGMGKNSQKSPLSTNVLLRPEHTVIDIIYYPLMTPLIKRARKSGCQTYNGLGMLVYQAAVSFQLWTGKQMPVNQIYKMLLTSLSGEEKNDH